MTQPRRSLAATIVNGVNVSGLLETVDAIRGNPEIAQYNFRAVNTWLGGERNRSTIKEFSGALTEHRTGVQAFIADNGAPEVLFGDDAAPSPAEWLLHALVGCLTTTTAYHAAARGILIEAIDSEIDGDLDLRGFLGVWERTRKGYSAIRVSMRVKSKATPEAIRTLAMMSPVYDVVANSVPVSLTVETC